MDTTVAMSTGTIAAKGRRAGKSPWVERLGRAGLVAKGVLYAVVGILAIKVALGGREESPDKEGALRAIAEQPFGKGLLLLLAAGLAGYALWRLAQGLLDRTTRAKSRRASQSAPERSPRPAGTRCSAGSPFRCSSAAGAAASEQQTTAGVFERPLGRYTVYAAGLAFLGAAVFNGYRAVTCKFNKKLKTGEMSEAEEGAATAVGILGHLARLRRLRPDRPLPRQGRLGVRPKEARGLDGALLELSQQPYGRYLLGAVAVGLLAYGLYCFVQARYRRI